MAIALPLVATLWLSLALSPLLAAAVVTSISRSAPPILLVAPLASLFPLLALLVGLLGWMAWRPRRYMWRWTELHSPIPGVLVVMGAAVLVCALFAYTETPLVVHAAAAVLVVAFEALDFLRTPKRSDDALVWRIYRVALVVGWSVTCFVVYELLGPLWVVPVSLLPLLLVPLFVAAQGRATRDNDPRLIRAFLRSGWGFVLATPTRAAFYLRLGDPERAGDLLENRLRDSYAQVWPGALVVWAQHARHTGDLQRAMNMATAAVELAPAWSSAWHELAAARLGAGLCDEVSEAIAEEAYDLSVRRLALRRHIPYHRALYAQALVSCGRSAEARERVAELTDGIDDLPIHRGEILYRAALTLEALGEDPRQMLQRCVDEDCGLHRRLAQDRLIGG